jgi:hypothetical protein
MQVAEKLDWKGLIQELREKCGNMDVISRTNLFHWKILLPAFSTISSHKPCTKSPKAEGGHQLAISY